LLSTDLLKGKLKLTKYENELWDRIIRYFIAGKIYHPVFGGNLHRQRGLTSGSFFTNIVGGIANLIMNYYTLCVNNVNLGEILIKVCGDDNLVMTTYEFDVDKHSKLLNETFHVKVTYPLKYRAAPYEECLGHFLGSL